MYAITIERQTKTIIPSANKKRRQNAYLLHVLNVKKYLSTEFGICLYEDLVIANKVKSLIENFCTDSRWSVEVVEYVENKYPAIIIQQTGLYYHAS